MKKPKEEPKPERSGKFPPPVFARGYLAKKRREAYLRERETLSRTSLGDLIK